jgi:hypothetical protein
MNYRDDPIQTGILLMMFIARSIREEMLKTFKLKSDVISATELNHFMLMMILKGLSDRMSGEPEDKIQKEWCEQMEFIEAVTERF